VAGNHQEVTQAGRLEVPGQGRIESGIVAQGQAHQQAGLAWREQPGDGPTHERAARLGRPHERVCRRAEPGGNVVTRISAAMAPRSRASDSLLGCFVWRLAPMSARPDDAPDNCERSQRLHQASSGREAVPECKLHGGLPVRSAPRRKRPGLRCRGSHPRRLAGGSQYALLTPQNLARVPALGDMPPRHLPLLPVRIIRPGGSVPIRSPSVSQGLHAFSPLDGSGPRLRPGTREDSMGSE
jgi:hypothetical protein